MPRKRLTRDRGDAVSHRNLGQIGSWPVFATGEIARHDRRGTGLIWTRRCLTLLGGTGAR
jgi:hypothetical protein